MHRRLRSHRQQRRRWTANISEWTGLNINDAARVAEDRERFYASDENRLSKMSRSFAPRFPVD